MPEKIDLDEIVRKNPQIDLKKLGEGRKMLEELRKAGVKIPKHRAVPPHARKRLRLERLPVALKTDRNA